MSANIHLSDTNTAAQCLRVGVTGGMGSGKSMVCKMLHTLGAPVYDADTWAKWLLHLDENIKKGVIDIFGPEAYDAQGAYQRAWIAGIVFQDAAKLAALNALVHPAVEQHSRAWHEDWARKGAAYTVKEAALMIESGSYRHLDFLIVVAAPEELRVQRVCRRDQLTEAQVRARINKQMPESEKIKLADFVIHNDGKQMLIPQVWVAHQQILQRIHTRA